MRRKQIIEALMNEGFSQKTLINFNDKQIMSLYERIMDEQSTLNIPQGDTRAIDNAKKNRQVFATYEQKGMKKLGKKKLSTKQSQKMDTDKDGDIDAKDLSTLRNKNKKAHVNEGVCSLCGMKKCKCKDKKHKKGTIAEKEEKWIQKATHPSKKGSLKKALGVKKDETIPAKKLKAAAKKKGKLGQRARFAMNVKGLKENKKEINEWVNGLANQNYYPLTSKKEIVNIIQSKLRR